MGVTAARRAGAASTARSGLFAEPRLTMRPGVFVYCRWPRGLDVPAAKVVAVVDEDDGFTVIMSEARAKRLQLVPLVRCRWISLGPKSASDGVGLTAGAAAALADVGIACNLIAALDHDHLFVPVRHSARAMLRLQAFVHAVQVVDQEPLTFCQVGKRV